MNALLTEFDERYGFGRVLAKLPPIRWVRPSRTDTTGFRLALIYCLTAVIASILSIFSRASTFTITLQHTGTGQTHKIYFGYLYELNAAFFYLILAPIFVFFAVQFIYKSQYALQHLTVSGQLTSQREPAAGDPLAVLGQLNRRIFRPTLIVLLFVSQFFLVVGTELSPHKGDYYTLAFGYVQAPFIQSYQEGTTLQQLRAQGREVGGMGAIDEASLGDWKIVKNPDGPKPGTTHVVFWVFLFLALSIQVLFIPLAVWIVLKGAFLLFTIYRAVAPNQGAPLALRLDFKDPDKAFGLAELNNAYKSLLVLVFIGAAGMATAVFTNFAKGTSRLAGGESAPALGILAQSEVALLPLILMVVIAVSLFLIYMKAEAARVAHITELDSAIATAPPDTKITLEKERKLACDQSPWPDLRFRAWLSASLPTYVCPSLILQAYPGVLDATFRGWKSIVDAIQGAFHIFMR